MAEKGKGSIGLAEIAGLISGESEYEYDCPSCKQTLTLDSFGKFVCPYCKHKFRCGIEEIRIGEHRSLWRDRSLRNRKIASIITTGAVLIGAAIVLFSIANPGPVQNIGGIIFIVYVFVVPSFLVAIGILSPDWKSGSGGDNSGGGGGG